MRWITYLSRDKKSCIALAAVLSSLMMPISYAELLYQAGPNSAKTEVQERHANPRPSHDREESRHRESLRDNYPRIETRTRIDVRPPIPEYHYRAPAVQAAYHSPYWDYDRRFEHNHYYPARGYRVDVLPPGYLNIAYGRDRFFFHAGVWFRETGSRFVVVSPPLGLVIPVLPPTYVTVWRGNTLYYYANDVYYTPIAQGGGYQVVLPPPEVVTVNPSPVADIPLVPEDTGFEGEDCGMQCKAQNVDGSLTPSRLCNAAMHPQDRSQDSIFRYEGYSSRMLYSGFNDGLFVYPRHGQAQAQTTADHEACDRWAVSQTNYNPMLAGSTSDQSRKDFERAVTACLDARGYSVR